MNVIARLEFELTYYDSAIHRFSHYTTKTPPILIYENINSLLIDRSCGEMPVWERVSQELLWFTPRCNTYPEIDIYRGLLFFSFFHERFDLGRASQPRGHHPWEASKDNVTYLLLTADSDRPLGSKVFVIYIFLMATHFPLVPHLHGLHGISAAPCLP